MTPGDASNSEGLEGLLGLYRIGAFPMADPEGDSVSIYTADPRAIIPLDAFHVPRSVERDIRRGRFELTTDRDFRGVIRGCADSGNRRPSASSSRETWINPTIMGWFEALHAAGHAHSLEAWRGDPATGAPQLVGGIYGLAIGSAFFAESMFHAARDRRSDGSRDPLDGTGASNVCLAVLLRHLADGGFELFDVQFTNPHIARFGVTEITRGAYLDRLDKAVKAPDMWRPL